MISIILVSHSQKLAEGLHDLLQQMSGGRLVITAAGGMENGELGTSFEKVFSALEAANQLDGALVFVDLGSAELTTRLAIEMLSPEQQAKIRISPAPLVEGSLAAAAAAGGGQDLDSVYLAALDVLEHPKLSRTESAGPETQPGRETAIESLDQVETTAVFRNLYGLHARPAAQFVQLANRFNSKITVTTSHGKTSPGTSIFGLVALFPDEYEE